MSIQIKSRDELPWLYYPRSNSVRVINSHLVPSGGGGSLAVNGKSPVAAWVPSLDTAGNGTTTLTDLIGSNNGTLTNMDAATDWVADTDAGGVRALDFDGVNDNLTVADNAAINFSTAFSVSVWVKIITLTTNGSIIGKGTVGTGWLIYGTFSSSQIFFGLSNGSFRQIGAGGVYVTGSWIHIVAVYLGTGMRFYVNGTLRDSASTSGNITPTTRPLYFAANPSVTANSNCRIDDVRLFNVGLDSSDVSYMYNSGNGRGRTS